MSQLKIALHLRISQKPPSLCRAAFKFWAGFPSLRQRLNAINQRIELGRVVAFRGFSRFDLADDKRGEVCERLTLCRAPFLRR